MKNVVANDFIFCTSSVLQSNDDSHMLFIIVLNNLYQMCCRIFKKNSICHPWVIELDGKDTTWMLVLFFNSLFFSNPLK